MADDRYERTVFHGKSVDKLTKAGLEEMERRLGYELTITQGSFNSSVGASAGTHNKGGPVDLAPWDWRNKLRAAKNSGFAGWHRPAIPGLWGEHLHLFPLDHERMADVAMRQNTAYRNKRDGMKGDGPDPTPWRPSPLVHVEYPPSSSVKVGAKPVRTRMTKLRHIISLAIAAASDGAAHTKGARKAQFVGAERALRTLMRVLPKQ